MRADASTDGFVGLNSPHVSNSCSAPWRPVHFWVKFRGRPHSIHWFFPSFSEEKAKKQKNRRALIFNRTSTLCHMFFRGYLKNKRNHSYHPLLGDMMMNSHTCHGWIPHGVLKKIRLPKRALRGLQLQRRSEWNSDHSPRPPWDLGQWVIVTEAWNSDLFWNLPRGDHIPKKDPNTAWKGREARDSFWRFGGTVTFSTAGCWSTFFEKAQTLISDKCRVQQSSTGVKKKLTLLGGYWPPNWLGFISIQAGSDIRNFSVFWFEILLTPSNKSNNIQYEVVPPQL